MILEYLWNLGSLPTRQANSGRTAGATKSTVGPPLNRSFHTRKPIPGEDKTLHIHWKTSRMRQIWLKRPRKALDFYLKPKKCTVRWDTRDSHMPLVVDVAWMLRKGLPNEEIIWRTAVDDIASAASRKNILFVEPLCQNDDVVTKSIYSRRCKVNAQTDVGTQIRALAFIPGETPCFVSGEESALSLRHSVNGMMRERIGSGGDVLAVAISPHGNWIVSGATDGLTIWRREPGGTLEEVKHHLINGVRTIDISSDSKWVVTGSDARTVDLWDISTGDRRPGLGQIKQEYNVVAVKFCPCGRRLATATLFGSVRIYATSSGEKLLTIPISVMATSAVPNVALAWFPTRPQIFAVSQGQVKCLSSDEGSVVYQWALRGVKRPSSVVLSSDSKLIAYSLNDTVIIRDTLTRRQIGDELQHDADVSCIAFSPASDYLLVGVDTKFVVWDLHKVFSSAAYSRNTTVSRSESCVDHDRDTTKRPLPPTFSLPLMSIINDAVKPWLHSYLINAEEVLTAKIASAPDHDTLANRALVRGRRGREYSAEALEDAEKSLSIQKSAIGHIAKTIALINQNKDDLARQEICKLDIFLSDRYAFLLKVIQSILFCLSGKYDRQTENILELSAEQKDKKLLLLVQSNMHLSMKYFEHAMDSFKKSHVPNMFPHEETPEMWSISFIFGWKFSGLGVQIQQEKCEALLESEKPEAATLYCEVAKIYHRELTLNVELADWSREFRRNCLTKLENLGDKALSHEDWKQAIAYYKVVEPLLSDSEPRHALLLKRSRAYLKSGRDNWQNALLDADEAVRLDRYSPWGHERRHAVLYELQQYREAAEALDELVKCLADSRDPESIRLREMGVKPRETKNIITQIIERVLDNPRPYVLINTKSGRLCDKEKQKEVFRASPEYKDLILSPVSRLESDPAWEETIKRCFRYAMFSHTWEDKGEPEYRHLEHDKRSVDSLPESFSNVKLQTFCKKTNEHGYWWAWSDTCCINKSETEMWSMSLRSMYRWYSDSSLTIVHLKGVFQQLNVDPDMALEVLNRLLQEFVDCRWNKRAWTLQEYFASEVIQFYTEDWKPFLPVDHHSDTHPVNHKESRVIRQGMQLVTGLDADSLAALKPGTDDARQKLRLASTRKSSKKEDMAYSLFGIFKITIDAIYGDDEVPRAVGRLLGTLLTKSDDITILAWTGERSEYNTCLPAEISVFNESEFRHVPRLINGAELVNVVSNMQSISHDALEAAVKLYVRLFDSPPPELSHGRLKLSCIRFQIPSMTRDPISRKYVGTASVLGRVEIETVDNLSSSRNMVLVHPWFKLSLDSEMPMSLSARQDRALELLAALRQPFGALLLASNPSSRDYERVATDSLITVQIPESVSPEKFLDNISVLYIR